jgi:hypothetical protein
MESSIWNGLTFILIRSLVGCCEEQTWEEYETLFRVQQFGSMCTFSICRTPRSTLL